MQSELPHNYQGTGIFLYTRLGSPIDCRPSTAEAPPIGKIRPFSKITVTLEPVMQLRCPARFRIS